MSMGRSRRWAFVGLGLVTASEIASLYLAGGEAHFSFEKLPAWGSLYGLASCVAIIVVSKLIGKLWLMRREDYYDR
jgi:hypothetical protein